LEMPNLVAPAGWAFAIWGVIYIGEGLGMIWIFVVKPKDCQDAIERSVPAWCAANIAQCLWCAAFRPWAIDQLWVSAIMLGTIAACLFASQRAMLEGFNAKGYPAMITRIALMFPRSLHLGWTTAASIVNINSFIGHESFGQEVALCSLALSLAVALVVALDYISSGFPAGAGAIAWALFAVADGKPVGPDAVSLGEPVLQGMRYCELALAVMLLAAILFSAVVNLVNSLLGQHDKPEEDQLELSKNNIEGEDVVGRAISD